VLSSGPATAVAVSPDGRFLAAGGADGRIAVFEAASGRELWREEAHAGAVTGLSFAPGGNRCVSWGADRAVRLWTAEYRIGVSSPPRGPLATRLEGLEAPVRDASFDAAGTRVLVVLESRAPVVWTPGSSTRIALAGGADRATAARWSPDGEVIATAHPDGFARLQDPASGAEMRKFDMSRSPVLDVAWSGDGRWLFACAANGAVLKWNSGGAWSGTFSLDVRPDVARVHVHPKDGRVAVATGQRGVFEVRVFAPDGNGLARVGPFSSLPLPCDDWRRFASTDGADLVLRDASAKLSPERLRGHVSAVRALAADADGRTLASASEDGTAALWAAGMERAVVPVLAPAALGHVVYYADGARALATPSLDDPPKLVDIRTGSEIPGWEPAERVPVHRSADPTGRRIVAFFDQGPACLLDAATGKVIAQWEPEGRTRRGVAWSPAGRRFLFYSPDSGDVRSAEDGSRLETIVFDGGGVAEAIVPDGLPVAAWTVTEKTLGAFGPGVNASESPTPLREIGAPPAHLALHPENGLVLTESNGAVTRWHDRSRAPVRISWPRNEETLPRFSPDGRFLLLCGVGGGVLLMRGDSLELVLSLQPDRATEAIFLADGRRFLAWNRDRAAIYPLDPAEAARAAKPRELTDAERRRFRVLAQGK
jgi:WD40 repeat protein